MKNFLIGWAAVDQHVAVIAIMMLAAAFTGWVLYGEHKYRGGGR